MVELEDFKSVWAQYNQKLDNSLKLNIELFKKLNLDKSSRELNKVFIYELIGVVSCSVFLIFLIVITFRFVHEPRFFIPGIVSVIITVVLTWFTIRKAILLSKIDYVSQPVLQLQKNINRFNVSYIIFRKWELMLYPIFCIAIPPVIWKFLTNFDAYEHYTRYVMAIIFAIVAGFVIMYWVYYKWYDKKIKNAQTFLTELDEYNNE